MQSGSKYCHLNPCRNVENPYNWSTHIRTFAKSGSIFYPNREQKSTLNFKLLHLTIMTVVQLENKNYQHWLSLRLQSLVIGSKKLKNFVAINSVSFIILGTIMNEENYSRLSVTTISLFRVMKLSETIQLSFTWVKKPRTTRPIHPSYRRSIGL